MLAVRVIPCLDVDAGRVVKGVNFVGIRDAGDPVELAARYDAEGADELVFLDITASSDARDTMVHVVEQVADQVFIPFTLRGPAGLGFVARTSTDPTRILDTVRREIQAVDRQVALVNPEPLESLLQRAFYARPRFSPSGPLNSVNQGRSSTTSRSTIWWRSSGSSGTRALVSSTRSPP